MNLRQNSTILLRFLITVLAVTFVSHFPRCTFGIWDCKNQQPATTAKSTNKAADSYPKGCDTRFDVRADSKLERAFKRDPIAEYKYHFECVDPSLSTDDGHGLLHQRGAAEDPDAPGSPGCNAGQYPTRVPGIDNMARGYNILTDKLCYGAYNTPILDIKSSDHFKATVGGLGGRCYVLPDAFVAPDGSVSAGISYEEFVPAGFGAIGATTIHRFRELWATTRGYELGLHEDGFTEIAAEAALAQSEAMAKLEAMAAAASDNGGASSVTYALSSHKVEIQTPVPSNELILQWKKLRDDKTPEAYPNYFTEFGTHYFESASIGGRFSAVFTTKKSLYKSSDHADADAAGAQARARCIASKLQAEYERSARDLSGYDPCANAYAPENVNRSPEDLVGSHAIYTSCEGGQSGRYCPRNFSHVGSFSEWRDSVNGNPALILGRKRWITHLVEYVIAHGKEVSSEGERYKKVVGELGGEEQATKFGAVLKTRLREYLSTRGYCKKHDCGT